MGETKIEIADIMAAFKETIANQAEEIAVLKATIAAMSRDNNEVE